MAGRKVAHFAVTHPLGMHARVCSKWIKVLSRIRPSELEFNQEWIWIRYKDEAIAADSLFRLLETRIPCGAEFDLILDDPWPYDPQLSDELANIISLAAFEMSA